MHHMPSGVHCVASLRLAVPLDATRSGPRCLVGDTRRPQSGVVRGALPSLPDGPLSSGVCAGPAELGGRADPVWLATARVLWHLGYTEEASAAAFTQSYGAFQRVASQQEPSYRVKGVLTDGYDSTTKSLRTLFPGARLGTCLRHALLKLPKKLTAIASPVRQALRTQFHTLLYRARQRKSLRVFALGQRLRHFADHVAHTAGAANGERIRRWFQAKKAGWYTVLADPQMPVTSTLLDQAHNAIERKLFAMKGFHHPGGSQQAFLTGLAHLYNLVPYQRRAQHAGQCGVEVEGGQVPTRDWFLNLQILTSGGFQ